MTAISTEKRRPGLPRMAAAIELPIPDGGSEHWALRAARELDEQKPERVPNPVAVRLSFAVPEGRSRNLHDLVSPVLHLLVSQGVIPDTPDAITTYSAIVDREIPAGRVAVECWRTKAPGWRSSQQGRRRIGDAQRRRWAAIRANTSS